MFVLLDDIQEAFNRWYRQVRLVAVPFEVGSPPEDLPIAGALVVSCFGYGTFDLPGCIFPVGADLVNLDTLILDSERQVDLGADVWRWSPPLDEFSDELLAPFDFEL